jgi:hypothetical protein
MKTVLWFLFGAVFTPLFVLVMIWLISFAAIKQIIYTIHKEYVVARKEFYKS